MRRSAVLSLALVVALPAWGAAQVITLPAEPGFGFRDTPPTVPASRLIPQAMADAARMTDFRATFDVTRAFVVGTDLSGVPALLNVGIAQQLTTFPQSTSWGGHLDDTKDVTGPIARSSFAERAATLGKGVFSFGFGQQSLHYDRIDGIDLENGDLTFVFQHNNCCGPNANPGQLTDLAPDFERDLLEQKVGIDIDRNVFATVLEFGVTDRLDLGVVVPLRQAGHAHARVLAHPADGDAAHRRGRARQRHPDPRLRPARAQQPHDLRQRARARHRRHRRPRQGAARQDRGGRRGGRGQRQRADRRRGRPARHRRPARRGARHLVAAVRARRRPPQRRLHDVRRLAAGVADRAGRSAVDPRPGRRRPADAARRNQHRRRRRSGGRAAGRHLGRHHRPPGPQHLAVRRRPAPRSRRATPGGSPSAVSVGQRPAGARAGQHHPDPGRARHARPHRPAAPAQLRRAAAGVRRRPDAEGRRWSAVSRWRSDPSVRPEPGWTRQTR